MVVAFWGRGPSEADLSWIGDGPDPRVVHAARGTYDHGYQGTGNWPFNVAYAGTFGLTGMVTRLRSVADLERFVAAGVPVVTSQSYAAAELPGAADATRGHLFVVVGFTDAGDPIVNDPDAPSDESVQRTYPRAPFARVWLRAASSGGVVYLIYPPGHRLPDGW
jgi:hypothetical protein